MGEITETEDQIVMVGTMRRLAVHVFLCRETLRQLARWPLLPPFLDRPTIGQQGPQGQQDQGEQCSDSLREYLALGEFHAAMSL